MTVAGAISSVRVSSVRVGGPFYVPM